MRKKKWKQLIALAAALTVSISMTVTSSAVSFTIPTDPISTEDQVIKTTAARAGQVAPLILGCNLVASSNLGASSNDYNKVNSILGVFGSAINEAPDPYLYNFNYNFYAADNGKPVVANATISEKQSEGTAATPEVIQNMLTHRPDLILNQAGGIPDDVKYLAPYVLSHRLSLSREARIRKTGGKDIIDSILSRVAVPKGEG